MNYFHSFDYLITLYFTYQKDTILNFLTGEHRTIWNGQLPSLPVRYNRDCLPMILKVILYYEVPHKKICYKSESENCKYYMG